MSFLLQLGVSYSPAANTENTDKNGDSPLKMSHDLSNFNPYLASLPLNMSIESFVPSELLSTSYTPQESISSSTSPSSSTLPTTVSKQAPASKQDTGSSSVYQEFSEASHLESSESPPPRSAKVKGKKTSPGKRARKVSEDLNATQTKTQKVAGEKKILTPEEKKQLRAENNRQSAQRSRDRKTKLTETLKKEVAALKKSSKEMKQRIKEFEQRDAQMQQKVQKLEQDNAKLRSLLSVSLTDFGK